MSVRCECNEERFLPPSRFFSRPFWVVAAKTQIAFYRLATLDGDPVGFFATSHVPPHHVLGCLVFTLTNSGDRTFFVRLKTAVSYRLRTDRWPDASLVPV